MDKQIIKGRNLNKIKHKYQINVAENDFTIKGLDKILEIGNKDYTYIKDMYKIEQIPISNLIAKENNKNYLSYIIIALSMIILIAK